MYLTIIVDMDYGRIFMIVFSFYARKYSILSVRDRVDRNSASNCFTLEGLTYYVSIAKGQITNRAVGYLSTRNRELTFGNLVRGK